MIIVKIQGGLGNQLFQYATGFAISVKQKKKLFLDTSDMERPVAGHLSRSFMLDGFNIKGREAPSKLINNFKRGHFFNKIYTPPKTHIKQLVFDEIPATKSHFYKSHFIVKPLTYIFYKDILEISNGNMYIDGYWQAYKYFEGIEDLLKNEFVFKPFYQNKNEKQLNLIQNSLSVSIHIRRTDYVNTEFGKKYFISLPLSYYYDAIKLLELSIDNIKLFVFSDDIEWCKENLKTKYETHYISNENPLDDLFLMSNCKHNIVANSSFSWWAAWLNNNRDKKIISPAQWYYNVNADKMQDLLPNEWLKVNI